MEVPCRVKRIHLQTQYRLTAVHSIQHRSTFHEMHEPMPQLDRHLKGRSEERRVGKECRCGGAMAQAEDGIRDRNVTGVQTCALPISRTAAVKRFRSS